MLIYKITNIINNKRYTGKLANESKFNNYWGSGKYIKRAIKKHSKKNFKRIVLESEIIDHNLLCKRERYWIKKEKSKYPFGYNLTDGGCGLFGYRHSEKSKTKNSLAHKNLPQESIEKYKRANLGKNNPMWGKTGKNCPNYGRKPSKETITKISKATSGKNNPMYGKKGKDNPNFGLKRSEEAKEKYKQANLGKNNPMYGKIPWNKGLTKNKLK